MMRTVRPLRVFAVLLFVIFMLAGVFVVPAAEGVPGPALTINAAASNRPISPDIYGMNPPFGELGDAQLAEELRLPVNRWGGNHTTRYNWQTSMFNHGSDWYFENDLYGPTSDQFVDQNLLTGTKSLVTIPTIGWTTKDPSHTPGHPHDCGFSRSKYGPQQDWDWEWDPDCGNGNDADGIAITGNDPTDTSTAINTNFVTGWINHLVGKYGTAENGGVAYYALDNEPDGWHQTHRDVHPDRTTYQELWEKAWPYASAIKAADPTAKIFGPVVTDWCGYLTSAADQCDIWPIDSDFHTHGSTWFVEWYLQKMNTYEQQNGQRILDYLDVHNYPQGYVQVDADHQEGISLSFAGGAATKALRLRSTRELWDPNWVSESWVGVNGDKIKLIPRMHEWVDANYPGTKLAISEYNWGGLEDINGALAQADVLGIFGREGLDLATLWVNPIWMQGSQSWWRFTSDQPGVFAFRMYRNYDGAGHGFGDTSISAASADQGVLAVYGALRSSDNALTLMVINKTADNITSTIGLSGFTPAASALVYRYSPANLAAIEHLADQALTADGFNGTFPGNSITLFVIPSVQYVLTVNKNGTGSGTVGGGGTFNANTTHQITATPDAGSTFTGWSGDCIGTASPLDVLVDRAKTCTATFSLNTTKVLTTDKAIATWPAGIPVGEKRPVVVFLPGWGGCSNVVAGVSGQNLNLVKEGYITLAIGFDYFGTYPPDVNACDWSGNLDWRTQEGLDKLCAAAAKPVDDPDYIPANCNAIVLDGSSYGGIQNDLVIRYLRSNGYTGGTGRTLGFVSEDAGYVPPGNWPGGPRTGLADTDFYSVAMIENLGDQTFDPDKCDTWGNCGARLLSNAHLARGDGNVFSICPSGGAHGDHSGFPTWNAWVISAIKTMIHVEGGIPTFTGYTNPALVVGNACVTDIIAPVLAQVTPVPAQTTDQNPSYTFSSTEAGVITYGGSCESASTAAAAGNNTITLRATGGGPLQNGIYNDCSITVTDAAGNPSVARAINPFTVDTDWVFISWVWLEGGGGDFVSIQTAYVFAANTDGLRARAAVLPEDVTFGSNKNITLRGGYNAWYESLNSDARGYTTIRSLIIGGPGSGGVTIENVIIK